MALQRLKEGAEKAKIELSTAMETEINLPFVTADQTGPKHLQVKLTRAKLEQLVDDLLQRTMAPVKQALADAGVDPTKIDEVVLVGGSTRMPKVQQLVREFFGKEPHKGVNPDEVVAVGAAVQGGVLTGDVKDMLLLDVTPLSLGIETLGGVMTTLIPRNTTIPTRKSEIFSTATDNQTNVEVHVLQGERPLARDNRTLGRFQLVGLPPAPRGVPQIEVAFDIDANGIVNVTAKDMATGKEQKITISGSSGLSKDDVDRMVKEAQSHASEDQARRELIDARNQADSLAYQVEKTVNENREKVPVGELSTVEAAIADVRKAAQGDDLAAIKRATDELQRASHAIAEQLYKGAQGRQAGSSGARRARSRASNVKDGEVVDAEYAETQVSRTVRTGRQRQPVRSPSSASSRRRKSWQSFVGDPFREFTQLQDRINRVFTDAYGRERRRADDDGTWVPPVDIYQTGDHELVLKAELPDMTREDIDITVDNGTLTIKGEKKLAERREGRAVPPHRAALRHVQPLVLAAADRRPEQGRGRVQERRADRAAAAARGSQAAADQGRRRGVSSFIIPFGERRSP